jgi:hypothetical protein
MKRVPIIVLAAVLAATPAFAAVRHEHKFGLSFSAKTPASATGVKFLTNRSSYKAPPQGQPADRVAKTTFILSPGSRTNPGAYPACPKTALEAKGPMACPKGSNVGSGNASVITGLPIDPINLTAQIFATKGGLLAYLTGSGQTQVLEMSLKGNKIVAAVPQKCLVPSDCLKGEAVLKLLSVTLKPGKLVTTPPKCPATRKWTNTAIYAYANGDTEKETSTTPCKR